MDEHDLDRMLGALRDAPAQPSEALMARVLADGLALQPRASAPLPAAAHRREGLLARLWQGLSEGFGGSGVLAGLGAAACVGVFLGWTDPSGIAETAGDWLASPETTLEFLPVSESFLNEG